MIRRIAAGVVWVVVVVAVSAFDIAAQTPYSSCIVGTVRDATESVLRGATVTITSAALIGGEKRAVTGADGSYRFTLLPAGVYTIEVQAAGFQGRNTEARIGSGATATIDFSLGPAGVVDAVEVRGSHVVDVRSAAVPARLEDELLQNLPTSRSIAALINLVPGIAADVAFGGSQMSNEILIDGVRTTEPIFQDTGLRANYNWVQEVNVVALGAPAEYGGFTGAAAYATLRSGSNRLSGLGEFWTIRPGWLDSNTEALSAVLQRRFLSRELLEWRDSSAQVGGPLRRDRLWFFAGVQHARHSDRPAGFSGPGSRDEKDLQVIVKPSASLSPNVRLDGFVQHGRQRITGDAIDAFFPIESSNDLWNPQTNWNTHGTWVLGDRTVVEGRYGGYDARSWLDPHPPAGLDGPSPRFDTGTQTWSQNTNWYLRTETAIQTASASVMHQADHFLGGPHELKVGLEYETTRAWQEQRYPGGRNHYDSFGVPVEVHVWAGSPAEPPPDGTSSMPRTRGPSPTASR